MRKWLLLIAALPLIFFSCRKDIDDTLIIDTEYQPPIVVITGQLTGQVTAENNTAVAGAIVRVGSVATTTDDNGFFQFRNIEMNARGTYVTVDRQGYFPGSTRLFPQNGSSNFVAIELLPKTIVGAFSGTEGGSVTVDGAKITLPANGVVDAMNNTYEGDVQVAAHWINPVASNLGEVMPGNLQGVNKEGREVAMATFGMLAVELLDEAGNELQVAPGRKAELTFPVPAELQGNAPAEIPLWSFDEDLGLWIEEGTATLQDGQYVGEASHFSFWNCDWPYPLVHISGTIVDQTGAPVTFQGVWIDVPGQSTSGYGVTDANGVFSGLVPADEILVINIPDVCGDPLLSVEVGPFSEDTDVGTITITNPDAFTINGTLVGCNSDPIDGGIVYLSWGEGQTVLVSNADGTFSTAILSCGAPVVEVQAFDGAGGFSSDVSSFDLGMVTEVGTITVCDNPLTEYINADANGQAALFFNPDLAIDTIQVSPDSINFYFYSVISGTTVTAEGLEHRININISDISVGTYSGDDLFMSYNYRDVTNPNSIFDYLDCWLPCDDMSVTITANGGPGGFLEGNFSGTMDGWNSMQQQLIDVPVSGDFVVEIPQ